MLQDSKSNFTGYFNLLHINFQSLTAKFFNIQVSVSAFFSKKHAESIFMFRKKHYFCSALVHYFAVPRKVIKRETGVIPVQSRCCKLL